MGGQHNSGLQRDDQLRSEEMTPSRTNTSLSFQGSNRTAQNLRPNPSVPIRTMDNMQFLILSPCFLSTPPHFYDEEHPHTQRNEATHKIRKMRTPSPDSMPPPHIRPPQPQHHPVRPWPPETRPHRGSVVLTPVCPDLTPGAERPHSPTNTPQQNRAGVSDQRDDCTRQARRSRQRRKGCPTTKPRGRIGPKGR